MLCIRIHGLYQPLSFGKTQYAWHVRTPTTQNHNCEQTLCKKNRNRTHQDQRSTGAMNLPWLRSLRGLKVDETLLLLFVVRHLPCLNRRCTFTLRVRTIRTTRHLHCSIVCRIIITFCRSLLHILVCKNPSAFLLHILSGYPQRNRHCLGLRAASVHKFLDVCRNILFAWL